MKGDQKPGVIVLSAPTAAGKNSLCQAVLKSFSEIQLVITTTTRPPRNGESNGVDYYFVSVAEFKKLIAQNAFFEYAEVHGNFYGTTKSAVEPIHQQGKCALLIIDVQGARNIRKVFPQTYSIFIMPPSMDELERRLENRGGVTAKEVQRRLRNAVTELAAKDEYDAVVVNDSFERASMELEQEFRNYLKKKV